MAGQTILVVEDSDDIRALMKMIIEMKGHRVLEAANGRQAIDLALKEQPELILMDLSMPVMDGWEATRRLRAMGETGGLPSSGSPPTATMSRGSWHSGRAVTTASRSPWTTRFWTRYSPAS